MLTDKGKAKEGGFKQVREALQKFTANVVSAEQGWWEGDYGKKEYLEIQCSNVEVLESTEELSMDISSEFNFRVNCSDYKNSFWVDKFLESADKFKILIPEGLIRKKVTFQKETLKGTTPEYDSTNYVIVGIGEAGQAPMVQAYATAPSSAEDLMTLALDLAIGKTEAQFKSAVTLKPEFAASPLLSLAKAGMLTTALVTDGKLVVGVDGLYQKP